MPVFWCAIDGASASPIFFFFKRFSFKWAFLLSPLLTLSNTETMNYFVKALKQYIDFNSRAHRKEYWMFFLFYIIFAIVASVLDGALGLANEMGTGPIGNVYSLALFIPSLAAAVRRLHDTGRSGWWVLIGLIPLVGLIWLIVLLASKGQAGANQYGDDPLDAEALQMA